MELWIQILLGPTHTTSISGNIQKKTFYQTNSTSMRNQSTLFFLRHLLLPTITLWSFDNFLNMTFPSFFVNLCVSLRFPGWCFFDNILCFCRTSRDERDMTTFSVSKSSPLYMLLIEILFLHGNVACLFFWVTMFGDCDAGGVSISPAGASIPSLSSSSLNSLLSFYSPFFIIVSHCATFIACHIQSPALPLLSTSSAIVFMLSAKLSMIVINGQLLINSKPLNIKIKLTIIRTVYAYAFLACWRHIIIIGVKYYFLRLGLGYIFVMTSASYLCMWSNINFKL